MSTWLEEEVSKIREGNLSVREAITAEYSPEAVAQFAETEQDYLDLASMVYDVLGTLGIHPNIREDDPTWDEMLNRNPSRAWLLVEIALKFLCRKAESCGWSEATEKLYDRFWTIRSAAEKLL